MANSDTREILHNQIAALDTGASEPDATAVATGSAPASATAPEKVAEAIEFGGKTYMTISPDLLPAHSEDELELLEDDILSRGVEVEILVSPTGLVVDGVKRLQIAAKHSLSTDQAPIRVIEGRSLDKLRDLRVALNVKRRHLSRAQIRDLIADRLRANPSAASRVVATALGVHHNTVEAIRERLVVGGEISQSVVRVGRDGRAQRVKARANSVSPASDEHSTGDDDWAVLERALEVGTRRHTPEPMMSNSAITKECPFSTTSPVEPPPPIPITPATISNREPLAAPTVMSKVQNREFAARFAVAQKLFEALAVLAGPELAEPPLTVVADALTRLSVAIDDLKVWVADLEP